MKAGETHAPHHVTYVVSLSERLFALNMERGGLDVMERPVSENYKLLVCAPVFLWLKQMKHICSSFLPDSLTCPTGNDS